MNLREIFFGGLWAASAIVVAGDTWTAYTTTYASYPTVDGGKGGSGGSVAHDAAQAGTDIVKTGFNLIPDTVIKVANGIPVIGPVAAVPFTAARDVGNVVIDTVGGLIKDIFP